MLEAGCKVDSHKHCHKPQRLHGVLLCFEEMSVVCLLLCGVICLSVKLCVNDAGIDFDPQLISQRRYTSDNDNVSYVSCFFRVSYNKGMYHTVNRLRSFLSSCHSGHKGH